MKTFLKIFGGVLIGGLGMLVTAVFHEFADDIRSSLWPNSIYNGPWTIFYVDTDEDGSPVWRPTQAQLKASLFPTAKRSVTGKMQTHVSEAGERKTFVRSLSGYFNDEYLMLSYGTEDQAGVGTMMFRTGASGSHDLYAGFLQGIDCDQRKIMQCPVVMWKGTRDTKQVHENSRLNQHLSERCKPIADVFVSCPMPSTPREPKVQP